MPDQVLDGCSFILFLQCHSFAMLATRDKVQTCAENPVF